MIILKNLSKTFQNKNKQTIAVRDVNLTIQNGEIYGIIGYSGAGKSTLIRMINLLEKPTSGNVIINENELTTMKNKSLLQTRRKIGMIFQHFNLLWSRTVYENIAFPLEIAKVNKKDIKNRVTELIQLVGLEGKENSYPNELSGGQKQRVGIARALANNPEVLLCDEATSALDPDTTDSILDLLKNINQKLGLTIILITHEMHVIKKICHKVAVLENGQVIEKGSVNEIFSNPKQKTTKSFVKQITSVEDNGLSIENLLNNYPEGVILSLKYGANNFKEPIISNIVRNFNVTVNILQGKVINSAEGQQGSLYIQMTGNDINQSIKYLKSVGVIVEVVKNV